VWFTDSGFNSEHNRRELQRGGAGYIVAQRLRGSEHEVVAARSRQGRYHKVCDNLEVKQVWVGEGVGAQRFVICRNLQEARRDAAVRQQLLTQLEAELADSDRLTRTARAELAGRLKARPGYARLLRATRGGLLRIDHTRRPGRCQARRQVPAADLRSEPVTHRHRAGLQGAVGGRAWLA
jgi:hypothetical protein